jgi:hypothetical protein
MYSALKQSVPQKPNNWLPVCTFKKPKANKLATGPQSVNVLVFTVCCKLINFVFEILSLISEMPAGFTSYIVTGIDNIIIFFVIELKRMAKKWI